MSWKLMKLEEVTSKIGDGLHGTPKYNEDGEYYFINGNNFRRNWAIDEFADFANDIVLFFPRFCNESWIRRYAVDYAPFKCGFYFINNSSI